MSSILVTGAAGFIGSHTVELAVQRGHKVRAIDAFNDYYDPEIKRRNALSVRQATGVAVEKLDLNTVDLQKLLDGIDVVIHLAGQPGVRSSWSEFHGYQRDNVLVTEALLRAALETQLKRLVYASSSSVYGNAVRYPVNEQDPTVPTSPYGVTKLAGELLCRAYAQNFGMSTACLRYFTVYGPRQRPDMAIYRLLESARDGTAFTLFGNGSQIRDFTFVEDVAMANLLAAEADCEPGLVANIAGGTSASMHELIESVKSVTGRQLSVERADRALGDVERTGGDVSVAFRSLGWSPQITLREGLEKQTNYIKLGEI